MLFFLDRGIEKLEIWLELPLHYLYRSVIHGHCEKTVMKSSKVAKRLETEERKKLTRPIFLTDAQTLEIQK